MFLVRNSSDLLKCISQSDEVWPAKICAQRKKCQRPVVVTTAHAESIAVCIEANKWRKNYIHLARAAPLVSTAGRFGNAEAVAEQLAVGCKRREAEPGSRHYGKKNFTSAPPGCADDRSAVEFAGYRQIQGQTPAAGQDRQAPDPGGDPPGCLVHLVWSQCAALRQQALAVP